MSNANVDWSQAPAAADAWEVTEYGKPVWMACAWVDVTCCEDAEPVMVPACVIDPAPAFGWAGGDEGSITWRPERGELVALLCDVVVDGARRQAWFGPQSLTLFRIVPWYVLRREIEACMRERFGVERLQVIAAFPRPWGAGMDVSDGESGDASDAGRSPVGSAPI